MRACGGLLALLCGCSDPARTASAPPSASEAGLVATPAPESEPPREPHETILAGLRNDASVLPRPPSVHPLHTIYNREAVVPAMCYTRTDGRHNPCYVCHQNAIKGRPNSMDDGDLQEAYSFSELGKANHWRNLFEDRRDRAVAISDSEIVEWVGQDNYSKLAPRLRAAGFKGYVPDLRDLQHGPAAFDEEGFAKDGSHWVAFSYKPMPSTFWPTNGAIDDVMIRLPEAFRTTAAGSYSRDVYKTNLALVEAKIKGLVEITVRGVDERTLGEDLDGDGRLGPIERIAGSHEFVGAAKGWYSLPYTYPLDTEFLHSVRYLGVDDLGSIYAPPRMKELRYMRKRFMLTQPQIYEAYLQESYDKEAGYLPGYVDRGHHGLDNEMGWVISGFIEDTHGELRFNTFEENLGCMGCHSSLGSTIDNTFSFARKVDGAAGWGYLELRGMPDAPTRGESRGEIATYLARAGGGSELRNNPEMESRWFTQGQVDPAKLATAKDVYDLIAPSRSRALELNKAYRVIVQDQDFIYGKDPTTSPPTNVYEAIDNETSPTLPQELTYAWDIRLDWQPVVKAPRAAGTGAN